LRIVSLLLVALSSACGPLSQAPNTPTPNPKTVTIGVVGSTSDGAIFLALDRGYFRAEGIDLQIERFQTLVDMVAPLTSRGRERILGRRRFDRFR
jgi:ABC-type nitrate/sulfonate/bicarbonate transport system substrate-binding protein